MKTTQALLGAISLVALSGCQGMPWQSAHSEARAPSTPDMSSYFAQRIHDGRRHLAAYRLAAAIEAFRQASYNPDFAGEAFNGMAVAYDRLGRYDLAERYFRQAVAAAPQDARFARNAARFDTAQLARAGAAAAVQPQLAAAPAPAGASLGDDIRLEQLAREVGAELGAGFEAGGAQRMQRVSTREVAISSRDDWTARVNVAAQERPAVVHVGPLPRTLGIEEPVSMAATRDQAPVRVATVDGARRPAPVAAPVAAGSRFASQRGRVSVRVSGTLRSPERAAYPVTVRLRTPG
ncbi:tetratricopeptide repeat protein [Aurantiacibacter luteus]|uniref:tetratricopeptide repeat protein n=1 Tax=Aurantiacibacter luteus TaxID=1581420 RepID=UPI00069A8408|nr:tetratricopeptide repeat protein [Aurantiacibacter luteus]